MNLGITMNIKNYTAPDFLGRDTKDVTVTKIQQILDDMKEKGVRYQDGKSVITGYAYSELFDWDLYFETLFLSYFGINKFCRTGVEMFLDTQHDSGFVARTIGVVFPRHRHHFKPFLAQIALLGARQSKDFRWLEGKYFDKLVKYLDYWFWHCDSDKNGLCFWDGSDASGMDNQARRLGFDNFMEFEGVDLNCYLVRELEAMAEISKSLGRKDQESAFINHAEALKKKINETFWDEEDGFYYDRNEKTGELNKIKSIAGFMPMWINAAPKDRADRLVKEHLINKDEFWLKYPVATWSKSEPDYYQERKGGECTWMGATWIPTNYIVFRGLINYGYKDIAKELADKTYEMVVSETYLREYYNGETGSGQGLCPFWGWSSLGYVMKAELQEGFSHSDLTLNEFRTFDGFKTF